MTAIPASQKKIFYIHRSYGEFIEAIGGSYRIVKEAVLNDNNKEILYIVGHSLIDSSCCGPSGCGYAIVHGVLRSYKHLRSHDGYLMSEVEPITDKKYKEELTQILKEREKVLQVRFRESSP